MRKIIFILIIFIIIFFYPLFFNNFLTDGDLYDAYIPMFQFIRTSYYHFNLPLISKSVSCGYPVYRDSSMGIYYPLNLLFLIPFNIFLLTHIIIILHLLILGIGSYKLMFLFSKDKYKSYIFMIITMFSGYTISHIGHYPIFAAICWVPYYFYFLTLSMSDNIRKNILFSILSLYLIISTGHPQIFLYTTLFSFLFFCKDIYSLKIHIKIYFFVILISSIFLIPMLFMFPHNVRTISTIYILMKQKLLITSLFPNIHYIYSKFFPVRYYGREIINEISFYSSVFVIFLIINQLILLRTINKRLIIIILIFYLLSFFQIGSFIIFNSPIRIFGFTYLIMIFALINNFDFKYAKKSIYIFLLLSFGIALLLFLHKFNIYAIYSGLLFIILLSFILYLKNKMDIKIFYFLLIVLIFCDLFYANHNILIWTKKNNTEQKTHSILKNKRVITYEPKFVGFYYDYIKNYFKCDDLSYLRSFSSAGNRGIYYDAYSYNISITLTYKEYIDYFKDTFLLNSSFTNIDFIFNTDSISYDYVFVPDMPIILNIENGLSIHLREKFEDTLTIFYTGNINFTNTIIDTNHYSDNYLRNINNLQSKRIFLNNELNIKGNGIIYMIKKNNKILHFPYLFDRAYFTLKNKAPYYLYEKIHRNEKENIYYVLNPATGKLVKKGDLDFKPIDLIIGFIIFLIGIILLVLYRKEKFL